MNTEDFKKLLADVFTNARLKALQEKLDELKNTPYERYPNTSRLTEAYDLPRRSTDTNIQKEAV